MNIATKTCAVFVGLTLIFGMSGCSSGTSDSSAQTTGEKLTEQAFEQQSKAVPYPADELKDSLERHNIRERLLRTNDPDKLGYVYLMNFGEIVGYYTVKGKMSSNQSQMTTDQLQVCKDHKGDGTSACVPSVVNAPGDDGSYGANEPGIFFFTTEGTMVTTDLNYIWSDQPLPIDVPRLNQKS